MTVLNPKEMKMLSELLQQIKLLNVAIKNLTAKMS